MRTASVLVVVLAASAAGCASAAPRPTSDPLVAALKSLGVEGRTYVNDLGAVSTIHLREVYPVGEDFLVEDIHGHLSYVDGKTLAARWDYYGMSAPFDERPDATQSMVVGVAGGKLYALSRRSGLEEIPPAPAGIVLSARPVSNDTSIFAPTYATPAGNKTFQTINLANGFHGWGWRTDTDIVADLVKAGPLGSEMVYAATAAGDVYGFPAFPPSERDPQPGWIQRLHAAVLRDLAVDGEDLGVVTVDNRLVCIDRVTGAIRWARHANSGETAGSAAQFSSKHAFYVCGGELRAFDRATGAKAWALPHATRFVCERGARTILAGPGSRLWSVDTKTGKVLASETAPGWTFPARPQPDATLFAVSDRGMIVGVEAGW